MIDEFWNKFYNKILGSLFYFIIGLYRVFDRIARMVLGHLAIFVYFIRVRNALGLVPNF